MLTVLLRAFISFLLVASNAWHFSFGQEILPFKSVFYPQITQTHTDAGYLTTIRVPIKDGYYLYVDKTYPVVPNIANPDIKTGASVVENDPYFGNVRIFTPEHPAVFTIATQAAQDKFLLHAQGCRKDVICYPPATWTLSVKAQGAIETDANAPQASQMTALPAQASLFSKPTAAQDPITAATNAPQVLGAANSATTQVLSAATKTTNVTSQTAPAAQESSLSAKLLAHYWLSLPLLILLGLGVSLTACVYPLIPIVTALIVGKNASSRRGYLLVSIYVLAMAAAMALLGAIFGAFHLNLQVLLQKPWIAVIVAIFFALLALSLCDLFTLRLPMRWQTMLDTITRKQAAGSVVGAAVMGALSVLVVSPCATPVLTALLLFTTQTTATKGALALFCFGLGTGLPLLVFASVLKRFMPKTGNWMLVIKKLFALLLLGVALWLIARLLPRAIFWAIAALYLLLIAVFIDSYYQKHHAFITRYLAALFLLLALLAGMQIVSPTREAPPTAAPSELTLKQTAQLQQAIATSEKPVIVDFVADWCISCKVMDKTIWHNPRFAQPLAPYQVIRFDVTDFNAANRALFQALQLTGPPSTLFYSPQGNLYQPLARVIGETSAQDFAQVLARRPGLE